MSSLPAFFLSFTSYGAHSERCASQYYSTAENPLAQLAYSVERVFGGTDYEVDFSLKIPFRRSFEQLVVRIVLAYTLTRKP